MEPIAATIGRGAGHTWIGLQSVTGPTQGQRQPFTNCTCVDCGRKLARTCSIKGPAHTVDSDPGPSVPPCCLLYSFMPIKNGSTQSSTSLHPLSRLADFTTMASPMSFWQLQRSGGVCVLLTDDSSETSTSVETMVTLSTVHKDSGLCDGDMYKLQHPEYGLQNTAAALLPPGLTVGSAGHKNRKYDIITKTGRAFKMKTAFSSSVVLLQRSPEELPPPRLRFNPRL